MSLSIFSFGKKRRSRRSRKSRKSMKRNGKKPSAKVMRMCRKCKVKTTKKVGKRRVYRPESLLVKLCKKKMRRMKKRKSRFGSTCSTMKQVSSFGKKRSSRRRVKRSVSRSAAMKAFKKFYSLHCKPSLRRSRFGFSNRMGSSLMSGYKKVPTTDMMMFGRSDRMRSSLMSGYKKGPTGMMFGNAELIPYGSLKEPFSTYGRKSRFGAGNPHTSMMMGYEFCPNGGGVLDTTGLFAAPCTTSGGVAAPSGSGSTGENAFGLKKRKSTKRKGSKKRKSTKRKGSKKRKSTKRKGSKKRKSTKRKGSKKRKSSKKKNGVKRKYTKKAKKTMADASTGTETAIASTGTETAMEAKEKVEFGARLPRRFAKYRNVIAACTKLKKAPCQRQPNCHYVKNRGCRGRAGTRKGKVYEGPM